MRQFSTSRTQVLRQYRSFDISKLSTTSQKNKNMFLNLRTNLIIFLIHPCSHAQRKALSIIYKAKTVHQSIEWVFYIQF